MFLNLLYIYNYEVYISSGGHLSTSVHSAAVTWNPLIFLCLWSSSISSNKLWTLLRTESISYSYFYPTQVPSLVLCTEEVLSECCYFSYCYSFYYHQPQCSGVTENQILDLLWAFKAFISLFSLWHCSSEFHYSWTTSSSVTFKDKSSSIRPMFLKVQVAIH